MDKEEIIIDGVKYVRADSIKSNSDREDKLQGIMSNDRTTLFASCDLEEDEEVLTSPQFKTLGKYKKTGKMGDCSHKLGEESVWSPTKSTKISIDLVERCLKVLKAYGMLGRSNKIEDLYVYECISDGGDVRKDYPVVIKTGYLEYCFVIAPRVDGGD